MRKIVAIFERELKSYFVSPIAYVVIALFIALSGIFFYLINDAMKLIFTLNNGARLLQ